MLKLKLEKRGNMILAHIIDSVTETTMDSFRMSKKRLDVFRTYTFGHYYFTSLFIPIGSCNFRYVVLFYGDKKYIEIKKINILNNESIYSYIVSYSNIEGLD